MGKGSQKMSNPCAWPSKTAGQPQVMAAVAGLKDCLLFVLDKMTKRCFLVDTGAEVSVVPVTGLESRTVKPGPVLLAANGSKIKSSGTRKLTLHFNSGTYHWEFVVAQVNKPLLGADFLRANKLLVDMANKQLVDDGTYCTSPLELTSMLAPHLGTIALTQSISTRCYFPNIHQSQPLSSTSILANMESSTLLPPMVFLCLLRLDGYPW